MTKQMLEAARQSARAADLALQVDRPFLLVKAAQCLGALEEENSGLTRMAGYLKPEAEFRPSARFVFHNYGKSPALISGIVGFLGAVKELPPVRDYSLCSHSYISVGALGPEQEHSVHFYVKWADSLNEELNKENYFAISRGTLKLIVYGRITYKDVLNQSYETGFCWVLNPPVEIPGGRLPKLVSNGDTELPAIKFPGSFNQGPKEYNYND